MSFANIARRLTNLEAYQESESHYNRSVGALRVVGGRREDEVEVSQERAGIGDEGSSHGKHRSDQTLVDKRINTAVLDHPKRVSFHVSGLRASFYTYFQVSFAAAT
jgi:hypothetical protein